MTDLLELQTIEVAGSSTAMGEALGEGLRALITGLVERRSAAAADYLAERQVAAVDFATLGGECLHVLRGWDASSYDEHCATAKAAGIDAALLYAMANLTDIRDLACIPAQHDAEGCTAVMVPSSVSPTGTPLAGQTWDLSAADVDCVVGVKRVPDEGPATWSVTVAGAPTLMGMNALGLAVGTTNIRVAGARVGVGYMSLLHRAVQCGDRREAEAVIAGGPRIAAHTYWFADDMGIAELECDTLACTRRDAHDVPLVRTNHCLADGRLDAEAPAENSLKRLDCAGDWALEGDHSIEGIRALFADRSHGECSINRRHDDGEPSATNACVIADPATRTLHACRGEADRGAWTALTF